MRLAIVIAAYNEGKSIGKVVSGIPKSFEGIKAVDCIVVDDGSKDKTAQAAKEVGAIVVCHPINRGQGAALKTGFDYALSEDYDIVVTFDADGQHKGEEIAHIIAPVIKKEVDAVLGSRFLEKKAIRMPKSREAILKMGVLFTRLLSNIKVTDTHNGFRAFSKEALQKIEMKQDRMEHASEILDQLAKHKLSYKEVPVTIEYNDYAKVKGQRNSNAIKIAVKMLLYKLAQ